MAEYTGKNLYVAFGTTDISGSYRRLTVNEETGLADASGGSDANRTYVATLKDGTADYEAVDQTSGTVIWAAVAPASEGTLEWAPEGTTATYPRHYVNAIIQSRNREMPYDDVVAISCSFQFSGVVTDTVY